MIEYQRTDTPPRPAAALVFKGRWTTHDPPLYAGELTPIQVVDFYPETVKQPHALGCTLKD